MKLVLLATLAFACSSRYAGAADTGAVTCQKLVVIGDSITKHGPAVARLGWSGNWGMGASSEDKDYVHLTLARIAAAQNGRAPQLLVVGGGGGKVPDKLGELPAITAFGADLAIIQLGENDNTNITAAGFQKPYEQILAALRAGNPKVRTYCLGVWAPPNGSPAKDALIQAACRNFGATFVSLREANANPLNQTKAEHRFTNPGVNWHPGDLGMQAYADALWRAFTGRRPAEKAFPPPMPLGSSEVLFTENWDGRSGLDWAPDPALAQADGHHVLEVSLAQPHQRAFFAADLPVEKIRGHTLEIETRVKAANISVKPENWNGIRLGLKLQDAEGRLDYPQARLDVGTYDWLATKWTVPVPGNITAGQLLLGLEFVTGTVDYDSVKITVLP